MTDQWKTWAQGVQAQARGASSKYWFGDRKVFLAALPHDKEALWQAHTMGLLTLARADLVAAMDPALVSASQYSPSRGVEYHFLVVDQPRNS